MAEPSEAAWSYGGSYNHTLKRKRTARACEQCRNRKHKCDGRQPVCVSCSVSNQVCSYSSTSKRRGLPTGYVRSLELLWALVFSVVPNSEKIVTEIFDHFRFVFDPEGKLIISTELAGVTEPLRKRWTDSHILAELEQRLSNLESNHQRAKIARTSINHATTERKARFEAFEPIRIAPRNDAAPLSVSNDGQQTQPRDCPTGTNSVEQYNAVSGAPLAFPTNTIQLLNTYFEFTHCWLPIVEKHVLFETFYASPSTSMNSTGNLALLWAISAFESMKQQRKLTDLGQVSGAHDPTPSQMYVQARHYIPHEDGIFELGHVQALIILSLYKLNQGELSVAWRLVGHATHICISMENRQHKNKSSMNPKDDRHSRTLLGCFVLDSLISCAIEKPPSLRTNDIQNIPRLQETGPDEWEPTSIATSAHGPQRAVSTFNHLVDICRVLNNIMWGPVNGSPVETHKANALHLQRLWNEIPPHCLIPSELRQDPWVPPQNINLHLFLKCTELLLQRRASLCTSELSTVQFPSFQPFVNDLLQRSMSTLGAENIPPPFKIYSGFFENIMSSDIPSPTSQMRHSDETDRMQITPQDFHITEPIATQVPHSNEPQGSNISSSHEEPISIAHNGSFLNPESQPGHPTVIEQESSIGPWHSNHYLAHDNEDSVLGQNFLDEIVPLDGIQWIGLSSQFMRNLGVPSGGGSDYSPTDSLN